MIFFVCSCFMRELYEFGDIGWLHECWTHPTLRVAPPAEGLSWLIE